jgi:hypothetical protein
MASRLYDPPTQQNGDCPGLGGDVRVGNLRGRCRHGWAEEANTSTSNYVYVTVTGALVAIAFGGGVLAFANQLKGLMGSNTDAFFMYPIGLLVALLWLYCPQIFDHSNPFIKWGGVISLVLITIVGFVLSISPLARAWVG